MISESFTRRRALQLILGAAATAYFGCSKFFPASGGSNPFLGTPEEFLEKFGPIDRTIRALSTASFSGDRPEKRHLALWNKSGFLQSRGGVP
jgi:hypothetical protein